MLKITANREKYKNFLLCFGYWAAIGLVVLLVVKYLLGALTPFIIALFVAAFTQPLANRIAKNGRIKKRAISVILALLVYIVIMALVVSLAAGLISAIINWASNLPTLFTETISPWLTREGNELVELIGKFNPDIYTVLDTTWPDMVSTIGSSLMDISVSVISWASSVGTRLPGIMLATVICVIATAFLASDYDHIMGVLEQKLPDTVVNTIRKAKEAFHTIIANYLKGYSKILLLTFAEISIGLVIIGFDNALLIAAIIAVFDILPIVGSGLVLLPWTIIKFIQGHIAKGIGLAILYLVVIIVRQIAEPKIVGKQVGLHPLLTLICMWVGLKVFGGVGMFALPISLLVILDLKNSGIILTPKADEAPEANDMKELEE